MEEELDPLACFGWEGEEEALFEGLSSDDEVARGVGHQGGLQQHDDEGEEGPLGGPLRVFAPLRQVCIWAIDADRSLLFKRQLVPQEEGGPHEGAPPAEESQGAPQTAAQGSCFWKELMQAGASYVRSRLCSKEPLFFSVLLFNAFSAAEGGAPLGGPGGEQQGAPQGAPPGGPPQDLVTPGIAIVLPLQEASISTIESLGVLAALDEKAFDEAFPKPPQRPPFSDLWWTLGSLLLGAQRQKKRGGQQQRVFIFTSIPDPCSSSSSSSSGSSGSSGSSSEEEAAVERNACIQRAHDLQSEQTEIRLFPLELQDGSFDFSVFWRAALGMQAGEEPFYLLLEDVQAGIERAGKRPRLLSSMEFFLTPTLSLPVCIYSSVSPPKLLKPQPVSLPSGVPLLPYQKWKTEVGGPPAGGAPVRNTSSRGAPGEGAPEKEEQEDPFEETEAGGAPLGEAVNPQELTKVIEHGNRVIEVTDEEVNSIKRFGPSCIRLLGFKPLSSLSLTQTTAASLFVTSAAYALADRARRRQLRNRERGGGVGGAPLETRDARLYYAEANRMLSSLILAADRKQVAAVVCFIPRRGASVALAALTPQNNKGRQERIADSFLGLAIEKTPFLLFLFLCCLTQLQEVDERGVTLQSSGFHLHRLPFKEDLRAPHAPWTWAHYSKQFVNLARGPPTQTEGGPHTHREGGGAHRSETSEGQEEEHTLSVRERQMLQLAKQAAGILEKLQITDFDVHQIPNAEKARQMAAIEAFALRLSVPVSQPDPLDPDKERFSLVDPLFLQWAERVRDAAPSFEFEASRLKRKGAPSRGPSSRGEGAPKKAPRWSGEEGPTDEDIRSLAASKQLERLTVPQLKSFLSRKRLPLGGHKADLVSRVLAHLP
ncbi:hypothetical protein Emed_005853 [Eimeria media]